MDLNVFFQDNNKVALAFSGGVDSAFLWYTGLKSGADIKAYYCKSPFQPQFEFDDAMRLATELGGEIRVIENNILNDDLVRENPQNRCYYCKRNMFSKLVQAAKEDGYTLIIDGTNASDDAGDRPGMIALRELSVRSPLRECGLTKSRIRELSKEAGLFTWNKPAYACLATRIPTGERITEEKLTKIEKAEDYLRMEGFTNFRVRLMGNVAKLQLPESQFEKLFFSRLSVLEILKKDFSGVLLDLEARNEQ